MIDINLLPSQEVISQKESELRDKFFLALWLCSLVLVVDLVLFFLISRVYKSRVSTLLAQRKNLTLQSEQLFQVALDLRTVQEKVNGYVLASASRRDFVPIISEITSLLGSQVELSEMNLNASSVKFVAKAADAKALNGMITRIVNPGGNPRLKNIVLANLRFDPSGSFDFQISADYSGKDKNAQSGQ